MPTFRLIDVDGNDLGTFRTSEHNWHAGDRIIRSPVDVLRVIGTREADDGDLVLAGTLIVEPAPPLTD